jgi:CheY-like chemotaxis protein
VAGSNGISSSSSAPPAKASEIRARTSAGRVLVVDDNTMVREVLERLLRLHGFDVVSVASGEEAVSMFTALHGAIDAVLLDMCMPGIDGLETLVALQGLRPDVKAVLLSGCAPPDRVQRGLERGALAFLAKPYDPQELVGILTGALAERLSVPPPSSRQA